MQIGRKTVLRGRQGVEQQQRADLPSMAHAVSDHVHEHFLARHAARRAIRKREVDLLEQVVGLERRHILDVVPVARP